MCVACGLFLTPALASAQELTAQTYPTSKILRPPTLPRNVLEFSGEFQYARLAVAEGEVNAASDIDTFLVGAGYGITSGVQAEAYIALVDFDLGFAGLTGAVTALDADRLDVAVTADLRVSAEDRNSFQLGADAEIRLSDTLALIGGRDLFRFVTGPSTSRINFTGGVSLQVTDDFNVEGMTTLLSVAVGDAFETQHWGDSFGLTLDALYALPGNPLDVVSGLALPRLQDGFDSLVLYVGARFRT